MPDGRLKDVDKIEANMAVKREALIAKAAPDADRVRRATALDGWRGHIATPAGHSTSRSSRCRCCMCSREASGPSTYIELPIVADGAENTLNPREKANASRLTQPATAAVRLIVVTDPRS